MSFSRSWLCKKILDYQKNPKIDLVRAFDLPHGAFCYGIKVSALKKIIEIKKQQKKHLIGRDILPIREYLKFMILKLIELLSTNH